MELEISIIDRVKNVLHIEGEQSALDLLILLRKHRNNFHPDSFTDEQAKEEAEQKFKEISELITELDAYIQREKINKNPMELALFQPLYENNALQIKIDDLINENERLKSSVENLQYRLDKKEEEIQVKQKEEISEKQEELIAIYKPTNNKVISTSIALVVSALVPILTKVESVSKIILKYSPFSQSQINIIMFSLFILIILISLIQLSEYQRIKKIMSRIKSPFYINHFYKFIESKSLFSETDVCKYILAINKKKLSLLSIFSLKLKEPETINNLKDVFLYNLISRELVSIACAGSLDRFFRVKEMPEYYEKLLKKEEDGIF